MKLNQNFSPEDAPGASTGKAKDLAAENKALKEQLSAGQVTEKAVRMRMAGGLTREQAEAAVRNQAAYEAAKKQGGKED